MYVHSVTATKGFVGRLTEISKLKTWVLRTRCQKLLQEEDQQLMALHFRGFTDLPFLEPDTEFLVLMMFCASSWLEHH